MSKKVFSIFVSFFIFFAFSFSAYSAKVQAPEQGGEGFQSITLKQAKKLHDDGATFIACHSHTTDFMKGHPPGTKHITCLVPKDHKRTDMPLSQVNFEVEQLPEDKSTVIVTYCASNT